MRYFDPNYGMNTLVNHVGEGEQAEHAHVAPIYQTSTFAFPDVATGAAIFQNQQPGYVYSRLRNPNQEQAEQKIAALEGLDLLRAEPQKAPGEVTDARMFASGMAAIVAAIQAVVRQGDTIIAQEALYSATYIFLRDYATRNGVSVVWLREPIAQAWEQAFAAHPDAKLAYLETPSNPTMNLVDIAAVVESAHRRGAWVFVDNTFASPYVQRPLTLGADAVLHSTTKYLSGHGVIVGGVVVSRHVDWVNGALHGVLKNYGASASPFDCWLTNLGLKTYALRMERHCANALQVARYLEQHPKVAAVYYPGLPSHPDYALALRQMPAFGGMMAFDLKGGLKAGETLMNHVRTMTLAVSLGNTDTLISHPASMTHASVPREERLRSGLSDGLVRLSVGIEETEDLLADFDQALACI
jgi:methionine-gamma-lyase